MKITKIEKIHYDVPIPVYDVIDACPHHNFLLAGNTTSLVSHNCVIFDECNFAAAGIKDIEKAKARMKAKYDTLVARVAGTFVKNGEVFGKLYVISSKNSDSDFMEEYISKQKLAGNKHMYIFDKPQWEVWPASKYSSDKKFYIALGGKKLKSYVVPDNITPEGLEDIKSQGYKLLQVPEDNKPRFLADFDIALRDIAGVSVPGTLSFITQEIVDGCIGTRKNPFFVDIITLGTKSPEDIWEYFHQEVLDSHIAYWPVYIHVDLSLNTDRTGISAVAVTGRRTIQIGDKISYEPEFTHIFSVAIQAPNGDKIPYSKILAFLLWLQRTLRWDIRKVTRDQYQSEYLAQQLEMQGFGDVPKISLDRTPDGYTALRSIMVEQRIDLLYCELLETELIHLQRDANTGIPDHPAGGSKDVSDSVAGAVWSAVLDGADSLPAAAPRKVASAIASVNGARSYRGPQGLPSALQALQNIKNRGI